MNENKLTPEQYLKEFFGTSYHMLREGEKYNYIVLISEYAAHQSAEKDARIKELEIRVRSTTNALIHIANAPLFDVDTVKKFASKYLSDIIEDLDTVGSVEMELEAVKKENADWKARNLERSYRVAVESCVLIQNQYDAIKKQLETAVAFLKEIDQAIDFDGSSNVPASIVDISIKMAPFLFSLQATGQDVSPAPTLDEAFELIYSEDGPEFVGNMHDIFKSGFEAAQGIFPDYVTTKK